MFDGKSLHIGVGQVLQEPHISITYFFSICFAWIYFVCPILLVWIYLFDILKKDIKNKCVETRSF